LPPPVDGAKARREAIAAKRCYEIGRERGVVFKQLVDVATALHVHDEMGERRRAEGVEFFNEALKS
jgi:hypothetical protein